MTIINSGYIKRKLKFDCKINNYFYQFSSLLSKYSPSKVNTQITLSDLIRIVSVITHFIMNSVICESFSFYVNTRTNEDDCVEYCGCQEGVTCADVLSAGNL